MFTVWLDSMNSCHQALVSLVAANQEVLVFPSLARPDVPLPVLLALVGWFKASVVTEPLV
jgi:hypothetical protein